MPRAPFLFPIGSRLGVDNLILRATAKRHKVDNYRGPLSIKAVLSGRVSWEVGGRSLVVRPSSFLVLSSGEEYSMNIDEELPVETCCGFFAPQFVEGVAADLTSSLEGSLDLDEKEILRLPFLSAVHHSAANGIVSQLRTLSIRCAFGLSPSGAEEGFLVLAETLLNLYREIREQAARVPAARKSTRDELFRRLLVGREYMHAHTSEPVSLAATARAACLSRFHFHRGFREAFAQTPHAYLTGLRLEQARHDIVNGSPVMETSASVGFQSPSAFTRLFRNRFGHAPSALTRKFARSGGSR